MGRINIALPAFPSGNAPGLTKQEYFAACALQGLLANPALGDRYVREDAAKVAASFAGAMISVLQALPADDLPLATQSEPVISAPAPTDPAPVPVVTDPVVTPDPAPVVTP